MKTQARTIILATLAVTACTEDELAPAPPATITSGGSDSGATTAVADSTAGDADSTAGDADASSGGGECVDMETWQCQAFRYIVWCSAGSTPGITDSPGCVTHDPADPEPGAACFGPTGTASVPNPGHVIEPLPVCLEEGSDIRARCQTECEDSVATLPANKVIGGVTFEPHVWCWMNGDGAGADPYDDNVDGTCTFPEEGPFVETGLPCGAKECENVLEDCPDYAASGATYQRSGYTFYASLDFDWVWDVAYVNAGILFACDQGRFSFYDDTFYFLTTDSLPYDLGFRTGDHTLTAWEHDSSYDRVGSVYTLGTLPAALDAFEELFPASRAEIHVTFQVKTSTNITKTIHVDIEE